MKHMVSLYKIVHYFILAAVFWIFTTAAHAQRVALLIGNSKYQAAPLNNPVNDVREMEAALTILGFKVQKVLDVNQNQMKRAVRDFGALAQGAEVAFVYYSGHGTQANGENYLLPIGASIDKESDYEVEAVSANALMRQIAGARPRAAIVVLDACRDNPYAGVTKSTAKGLGRMDAPTGTMIAFATSPNTTASDDGYYARVLAARLKIPGVELLDVFRDTTAEVRRLSGGRQEPRISEMSISDRIYLAGQAAVVAAQPKPSVIALSAPVIAPSAPVIARVPALSDLDKQLGMVLLPRGSYLRGSADEKDRGSNEGPVKEVRIGHDLLMARSEVTKGQFAQFVQKTSYKTEAEQGIGCSGWTGTAFKKEAYFNWKNLGFEQSDSHPVACVNWNDAQQYVAWLNTQAGFGTTSAQRYRLPSEAEWEFAARGVTSTSQQRNGTQHSRYPWGDDASSTEQCKYANGFDSTSKKQNNFSGNADCEDGYVYTAPVAQLRANAFGLHDMIGNVWEWAQDCYVDKYEVQAVDGSAYEDAACKQRVLRGGTWSFGPQDLRSAIRGRNLPDSRVSTIGFRIARTL
jgi:formylglycine-generating enzyme required for sulfatase activity